MSFRFRKFQIEDIARLAVHDGGILSWEPGCGKTVAIFALPQVKGAKRTLIVAPEQLHEQIIREGRTKFGLAVRPLPSQEAFEADADLQQAMRDHRNGRECDVRGWWITSYTALGYNGGDEWEGKENEDGEMILTDRIRELRKLNPHYYPGCDDAVGKTFNGRRCLWRPSLATLVADLFDCVTCDEAVRLKSNESYTSLGVRQMRPQFRYVMTATPIKNHLDDIFWLAWWIAGGTREANIRWPYAGTNDAKEDFANTFMVMERNHTREEKAAAAGQKSRKIMRRLPQICNLHLLWKLLSGVTIRRRKSDCGEAIVAKVFIPITVKPGRAQQEVYRFHLDNRPQYNADGRPMAVIAQVLAQLTNLRQAALCPDSANLSRPRISLQRMREYLVELQQQSRPRVSPGQTFDAAATRKAALVAHKGERTPFQAEADVALEIVERMIARGGINLDEIFKAAPKLSAKLSTLVDLEGKEPRARSWTDHNPKQAAILQLIHDLISKGEQVMVLTPFQQFNASLYERLVSAGVSVCLLDGGVSPKRRGAIAEQFKRRKFAVLIGGDKSMGEGGSFENCSNLIRPSLDWAFDTNRQSEDRPHRLVSPKDVTIYEFGTDNTIDQRILSVYHEKGDSANLALDGSLFTEQTAEINLGELLADAIRNFDPAAETIDEKEIEREWNESLRHRLTQAERAFRQFHPAILTDVDGGRVTKAEVRAAVRDAGIEERKPAPVSGQQSPVVGVVRSVPAATFALLIDNRDPAVIEATRAAFIDFCNATMARDWRSAWRAFAKQHEAHPTTPPVPVAPTDEPTIAEKAKAARDYLAGL